MLDVATEGQLRILHLNRPQKRNALSFALCQKLTAEFDLADQDPDIHAILLTAEPPAFCAGMDLKEVGIVPESEMSLIHDALFTVNTRLTTPLVAAVSGAAVAGGTGLVASAHIVVAHPDSRFGLPEVKIGLWPLLVYRAVSSAIGQRRATEWSLTGRTILAAEALSSGLIAELHEAPEQRAREIAMTVASYRRDAISVGLDYVNGDQSGERARQLRALLI
jgi:enoyl-CoA hydratase/carnithine racemase